LLDKAERAPLDPRERWKKWLQQFSGRTVDGTGALAVRSLL
jgi:hypothetical protein